MPMETGRPGTEYAGDSTLTFVFVFVCVFMHYTYVRTILSVFTCISVGRPG